MERMGQKNSAVKGLIEKIKSLYALHYSKMIQLGSLKDDKGFEIINDIKISSLFRNGDVLCVFVKEVGDYKSSNSNGLINYDYKENKSSRKDAIIKDYGNKNTSKDIMLPSISNLPSLTNPLIPNPPNITITSIPKTKLPIKEEERSLTMNPITENLKEEKKEDEKKEEKEIKKPRKRRTVKPKEDDKKIKNNDDKIKNDVEDPFSVFEDLKKKSVNDSKSLNDTKTLNDKNPPLDTPSKIQPPVLNPIPKENKKDIKELKKKSKVDYNKVDD
jgi:hypothetical protein